MTRIQKLLSSTVPISIAEHERRLAELLVTAAIKEYEKTGTHLGTLLAASFDLFLSAEYYRNIIHTDWVYCPEEEPLILYVYTNACGRCLLKGNFHFHPSKKPASGVIGQATSRLLCVFFQVYFEITGKNIAVFKGNEPIDAVFVENDNYFLVEIKSSPLVVLPLVCASDKLISNNEEGMLYLPHTSISNPRINDNDFFIVLPRKNSGTWNYVMVSLGKFPKNSPFSAYYSLSEIINNDGFISAYSRFWQEALRAYTFRETENPIFWLTNGCGQPVPRPHDWPARRTGGGYESVSDGKTSVGLDRTDDIKKGIYQVLKMGSECKPFDTERKLRIGLLSNIHAARHHHEYLSGLEDVVWTIDQDNANPSERLYASDKMYNLFDGIITFTKSHIRDPWLNTLFTF